MKKNKKDSNKIRSEGRDVTTDATETNKKDHQRLLWTITHKKIDNL